MMEVSNKLFIARGKEVIREIEETRKAGVALRV